MAQKVAAPSLRLNINRHFKACWFSDRVYAEIFHKNFKTLKFLRAIFSFLGNRSTISHFQATPKNILNTSTPLTIQTSGAEYILLLP